MSGLAVHSEQTNKQTNRSFYIGDLYNLDITKIVASKAVLKEVYPPTLVPGLPSHEGDFLKVQTFLLSQTMF